MNWLRTAGVEESLSARRAWIEMLIVIAQLASLKCRSPQGERG